MRILATTKRECENGEGNFLNFKLKNTAIREGYNVAKENTGINKNETRTRVWLEHQRKKYR